MVAINKDISDELCPTLKLVSESYSVHFSSSRCEVEGIQALRVVKMKAEVIFFKVWNRLTKPNHGKPFLFYPLEVTITKFIENTFLII